MAPWESHRLSGVLIDTKLIPSLKEDRSLPARPQLHATERSTRGKRVKHLRRTGEIPANLVEARRESTAIQVPERELADLVRQGGSGHLVDLIRDGQTEPVLTDSVEVDALTNRLVHAVFRRVDLTKPVTVRVPVQLEGTAPATEVPDLVVIQTLNEIEVSALPTEIPSRLIGDATALADAGDGLLVESLRAADGTYAPVTDPSAAVAAVHFARIAVEEEEEEVEALELLEGEVGGVEPGAEPAAEAAKPSAEGAAEPTDDGGSGGR